MSCVRYTRAAILEYLISRPKRTSQEMETHLRMCDQCRRDAAALDRLTRVLEALRAQTELKPPDGFFAGVLQECRAILPKVASERRPAIRTAAAHGVGTRLFAAAKIEKKSRIVPIVAFAILAAATIGAVAGALKAGLVTRALAFAEPGGWTSAAELSRELSEADSSARLRALSEHLWRVVTEELYWVDVDVERVAAFDLARHVARRQDVREPARLCAELLAYREVRRPEKVGREERKVARAWVEAVSVGRAKAARTMIRGRDSRLMRWLRASSWLELGRDEAALKIFKEMKEFPPGLAATVYVARKLGDDAAEKEAFSRITHPRLRRALSRR